MRLTIEEARELYKQGSLAKEIALREFTEEEILNDYTQITSLSTVKATPTSLIYTQLYDVYQRMSKGREVPLTSGVWYAPNIILSTSTRPNTGKFIGRVEINSRTFDIYIGCRGSSWEGRLGFENIVEMKSLAINGYSERGSKHYTLLLISTKSL